MASTWHEPARDIPIIGDYEIVVCGGGPAGCAAAVTAARHGARTLLVEREGALGGAPVTQNVCPILSTNGVDFQGIWHDMARALKRYNGITEISRQELTAGYGPGWYVGSIDPVALRYAWDDLLADAGADILHLAAVAGVMLEGQTIRGVIVETRGGRKAVAAERVIDATGDAAVAAEAGAPWEMGADGKPWAMGVSVNAWYGNVRTEPNHVHGTINRIGGTGRSLGNLPLFQAGLIRLLQVDPLDPWALSKAMRDGRREAWQRFEAKRSQPGDENLYMAGIADQPGIRSSRRVRGMATAIEDDAWNFNKYADGIARSSWEIDIHSADSPKAKSVEYDSEEYRPRAEKAQQGDYFDIRYGCLVPQSVENLLVAGRCISAEHVAQSSLRIQQTCLAIGQAAGTAAALSLHKKLAPRALDVAELTAQLEADRAATEPAFDILRDIPIAGR